MVQVKWVTCNENAWCSFERVNLTNVNTFGVYLIWYRGHPGRVVRLGQGDIKSRITAHRSDTAVTAYADRGMLVTWATVQKFLADGVERYLADSFSPLVGDAFPNVAPIEVNSPW
jgi:hypothetical protein